jgi:hypothetical protein
MDLKNKQEFETQEFESSMKNFGKEMKDLQRQLRDELKEMKVKVERRVREGKSI